MCPIGTNPPEQKDLLELEGVIDAEGNLAESETFPVMD